MIDVEGGARLEVMTEYYCIESRSDGFEIGYQKRWDHLLPQLC